MEDKDKQNARTWRCEWTTDQKFGCQNFQLLLRWPMFKDNPTKSWYRFPLLDDNSIVTLL